MVGSGNLHGPGPTNTNESAVGPLWEEERHAPSKEQVASVSIASYWLKDAPRLPALFFRPILALDQPLNHSSWPFTSENGLKTGTPRYLSNHHATTKNQEATRPPPSCRQIASSLRFFSLVGQPRPPDHAPCPKNAFTNPLSWIVWIVRMPQSTTCPILVTRP